MSRTTKTLIIEDCTFRWAKLKNPVNPFGAGDAWEVQIVTEDREVAENWVANNLNVKSEQVGEGKFEYRANLKRWCRSPSTGKNYEPPIVIGNDKQPIDAGIIGNGSKGAVKVYQYKWERGANSGITSIIVAVKVNELIEYTPDTVIDF